MTINEAYLFVQFVSNKNQRGNIKPSDFNLVAGRAQLDLFMQRYGNPAQYQYGMPAPRVGWQMTQKITDDLKPFLTQVSMYLSGGKFSLPANYVHLSSARGTYLENQDCGQLPLEETTNVDVVNDNELAYRLSSYIDKPTKKFPIMAFYDTYCQVYPKDMQSMVLTYLRKPNVPSWGYTLQNNNAVYDPTTSVDFEMPDETHNEICYRILSYLGVNLRDGDLTSYAQQMKQTGGE